MSGSAGGDSLHGSDGARAAVADGPSRALVLIGFMGSGKSTAAAKLAQALGVQALDSDRLLEQRLGHSIAQEFADHGEQRFREQEEVLVVELLAGAAPGSVLALGGGSVLSARVRAGLRRHLVVFLDADVKRAWERVRAEGSQRPLAADKQQFLALHAERQPLYEALADATLPGAPARLAARALPALSALSKLPAGSHMLWASAASGEYPVFIGHELLGTHACGALLANVLRPGDGVGSRAFCVTDETVAALYAQQLGPLALTVAIPPGEEHKTLASAERVWRQLARAGMSRADHVLALGGGVVGDLAGFCAATYQRGVTIAHVPTTLVAQVDSAYGGKTGVDLPEAKNYVGAYHQPAAVLADLSTLGTLPERELEAGWVEVLKTALIAGGELWRSVAAETPLSERTILECARAKLAIVAADERDRGRRQVLNLGHTIGHAIEAATGYRRYRHGEAVGLGLLVALELSGQATLREQVRELLQARKLPIRVSGASAEEILRAAAYDKKRLTSANSDGPLPPFVLVQAPGSVKHGCQVPEADVRRAVEEVVAS
jgi:shikimate kinase / 3-dehydroquinate synthase